MGKLKELHKGFELDIKVLSAWCASERNHIGLKPNGIRDTGDGLDSYYGEKRKVDQILDDKFQIAKTSKGGDPRWYVLTGFVDFYNKHYGLTDNAVDPDVHKYNNCVFYCSNQLQGEAIVNALVVHGFHKVRVSEHTSYVRTDDRGNTLSIGDSINSWRHFLKEPRELTYEAAIKELNISQMEPRTDFRETQIRVTCQQDVDAIFAVLEPLGYNEYRGSKKYHEDYPWLKVYNDMDIVMNGYEELHIYKTISLSEVIRTQTNTNKLNTKTNGNTIVCKPQDRVTRGERPKGTSVSSKTRPATITSRPLRNTAVTG